MPAEPKQTAALTFKCNAGHSKVYKRHILIKPGRLPIKRLTSMRPLKVINRNGKHLADIGKTKTRKAGKVKRAAEGGKLSRWASELYQYYKVTSLSLMPTPETDLVKAQKLISCKCLPSLLMINVLNACHATSNYVLHARTSCHVIQAGSWEAAWEGKAFSRWITEP